jgi:hypothetical protein
MIDGFLLGVIVTTSLVASAFFFRFWRQTRDLLFLGFALAFLIEGLNRASFLQMDDPTSGNIVAYSIRLVSYLLILAAIAHKNRAPRR